ncbi:MAG: HAD family hydrolase [Prevotella sp.]|nr:HAD family hydrolase [Prevotella sp.]
MKEYSTYIFDLDGTLLDTLNDLYQSVNYAMNECGFPLHTLEDVRRFVGNGVRMLMIRAIPDGDKNPRFEEAFDIFRKHYLQHSLDTTHPYPGIEEMLSQLKKRGKRLAVVSNKLDVATKELISHFFGNLIDVAIGENEAAGVRKKPAPDTVDEALRQLGVGKEGAVYVGDSDVDLQTAVNSKLPCISVLWGFRDRDFLKAHGASVYAETPEEIFDFN